MTATTEDPTVTLRLWADGTGEVIVEGVAAPIAAGALGAARDPGTRPGATARSPGRGAGAVRLLRP